MATSDSGPSEGEDPHDALRRIEERVQKVQDLGAFEVDRREDGRFHCDLKKPVRELTASETRQVLDTLESLSEVLRSHLKEIS